MHFWNKNTKSLISKPPILRGRRQASGPQNLVLSLGKAAVPKPCYLDVRAFRQLNNAVPKRLYLNLPALKLLRLNVCASMCLPLGSLRHSGSDVPKRCTWTRPPLGTLKLLMPRPHYLHVRAFRHVKKHMCAQTFVYSWMCMALRHIKTAVLLTVRKRAGIAPFSGQPIWVAPPQLVAGISMNDWVLVGVIGVTCACWVTRRAAHVLPLGVVAGELFVNIPTPSHGKVSPDELTLYETQG